MEAALRIQREAEIISFTHWSFEVLDRQDHDRLNEIMTYISLKSTVEAEHSDFQNKRESGRGN